MLYDSQDDWAFITTMGIDTATFQYILGSGFAEGWDGATIPHPDTNLDGEPRLGCHSLTAEGALGLIYHFLSSSMPDTGLQQIFALMPATIARYRAFALCLLLQCLRRIPEGRIEW